MRSGLLGLLIELQLIGTEWLWESASLILDLYDCFNHEPRCTISLDE